MKERRKKKHISIVDEWNNCNLIFIAESGKKEVKNEKTCNLVQFLFFFFIFLNFIQRKSSFLYDNGNRGST
jgi:hypothetical protein